MLQRLPQIFDPELAADKHGAEALNLLRASNIVFEISGRVQSSSLRTGGIEVSIKLEPFVQILFLSATEVDKTCPFFQRGTLSAPTRAWPIVCHASSSLGARTSIHLVTVGPLLKQVRSRAAPRGASARHVILCPRVSRYNSHSCPSSTSLVPIYIPTVDKTLVVNFVASTALSRNPLGVTISANDYSRTTSFFCCYTRSCYPVKPDVPERSTTEYG